MRCRQAAFLEKGHPKQILIIAQTATAALQVGFLQVDAITEFGVSRLLIAHAHFDIFAFVAGDAFRPKLLPKFLLEFSIARDQP